MMQIIFGAGLVICFLLLLCMIPITIGIGLEMLSEGLATWRNREES